MPLHCKHRNAMSLVTAIALFATACTNPSAQSNRKVSITEVSALNLKEHVTVLASDAYEGRGAGYVGEAMAAEYIAQQYFETHLASISPEEDSWARYYQPFDVHVLNGPIPWQVLKSQNVVGILPGRNPDSGYVVIGAHYDGQGKTGQAALGRQISEGGSDFAVDSGDKIWNSAVDNAVSVAAILELARVLSQSQISLNRSIVFVAFGAEESALDGSTYYVNNPVGGSGATGVMINLEKIVGDPEADFLYVSYGTSAVFPKVTKSIVSETGMKLLPFYPGVIANTDHYPFVVSGIPAITIGTGSVENVHMPTDHADGIDYELLARRTDFVASYLLRLANTEEALVFTGDTSGHFGASGGPATQDELELRNFTGGTSFKVATVVRGSLADQAGLVSGDLIIAVNGSPVPPQTFYLGLEDILSEETLCHDVELTIIRERTTANIRLSGSCN